MASAPFRPFDDLLDREAALRRLREAVAGADDGELYLERSESESLLFDDGRLKSAAYDTGEGFGLRVVAGETTGYAHASEVSDAAIARAASSASAARPVRSGSGPPRCASPPRRALRTPSIRA